MCRGTPDHRGAGPQIEVVPRQTQHFRRAQPGGEHDRDRRIKAPRPVERAEQPVHLLEVQCPPFASLRRSRPWHTNLVDRIRATQIAELDRLSGDLPQLGARVAGHRDPIARPHSPVVFHFLTQVRDEPAHDLDVQLRDRHMTDRRADPFGLFAVGDIRAGLHVRTSDDLQPVPRQLGNRRRRTQRPTGHRVDLTGELRLAALLDLGPGRREHRSALPRPVVPGGLPHPVRSVEIHRTSTVRIFPTTCTLPDQSVMRLPVHFARPIASISRSASVAHIVAHRASKKSNDVSNGPDNC